MERRGGDWIVGGGADDEEDYDGDEYDDEVEEGAETKEKEGQQQQDKDEAVEDDDDDDDEQGGLLQLDDEDDENQNVNVNSMASNSNGGNANVDVDADAAGRTKTPTAGQQGRGDAAAAGSSSGSICHTNHTGGHASIRTGTGISTATAARTAGKGNNNNNNNGGSARRRPLLPPPLTTTRRLFNPDALPMPPSSDGRDDINNSSSNTDGGSSRGAGGRNSARSDRRRLLKSGGAGAGTRTRTDADADADGHTNHSAAALHAVQGQGQGPTPEMQIQVHVGPHEEDPTFDWAGLFGPSRFPHQPVPSVSVDIHASTYATELVRARNEGWPIVVQDARGWAHFCCRWLVRCDDSKDACDAVAGANQHQQEEKREQQQQQQQRRTYFMDQPDPAKAAMTFPLCRYVEEGWSIDLDRMRMDLGHSLVPLSIFEPSGSSSSSTGTATGGSSEPSHVYREVQRVSLWTALPLIFKDYFSADDEGMADLQGCPPGCRYAINDYKFSDCKNASAKLSAQCSTCLEGAFGFDILSLSLGAELLPGRTLLGGELLGDPWRHSVPVFVPWPQGYPGGDQGYRLWADTNRWQSGRDILRIVWFRGVRRDAPFRHGHSDRNETFHYFQGNRSRALLPTWCVKDPKLPNGTRSRRYHLHSYGMSLFHPIPQQLRHVPKAPLHCQQRFRLCPKPHGWKWAQGLRGRALCVLSQHGGGDVHCSESRDGACPELRPNG